MEKRYISLTEVAKLIRKELKQFGHKFSVRSERYAGGSSIHISYDDGPSTERVEAVAYPFSGAGFDSMIDLKTYNTSFLGGEAVRFGVDFVFVSRSISDEASALAPTVPRHKLVRFWNFKDGLWEEMSDEMPEVNATFIPEPPTR